MAEPTPTHADRILHHLRNATKHADAANERVKESLQAHLDAHPVRASVPPTEGETNATETPN